jgi:hypothetical protein
MREMKYVKNQENGDILLIPCELANETAPNGIRISFVTLSRMGFTIHWFTGFLAGTEKNSDEYAIDGKTYHAFRDSGNVYLKETRDGGFVNIVGFSTTEIPAVLAEYSTGNILESGNASEI